MFAQQCRARGFFFVSTKRYYPLGPTTRVLCGAHWGHATLKLCFPFLIKQKELFGLKPSLWVRLFVSLPVLSFVWFPVHISTHCQMRLEIGFVWDFGFCWRCQLELYPLLTSLNTMFLCSSARSSVCGFVYLRRSCSKHWRSGLKDLMSHNDSC